MATKKKTTKSPQKVKVYKNTPGKLLVVGVVLLFATIGAAYVFASQAAPAKYYDGFGYSQDLRKISGVDGKTVTWDASTVKNAGFVAFTCYGYKTIYDGTNVDKVLMWAEYNLPVSGTVTLLRTPEGYIDTGPKERIPNDYPDSYGLLFYGGKYPISDYLRDIYCYGTIYSKNNRQVVGHFDNFKITL